MGPLSASRCVAVNNGVPYPNTNAVTWNGSAALAEGTMARHHRIEHGTTSITGITGITGITKILGQCNR